MPEIVKGQGVYTQIGGIVSEVRVCRWCGVEMPVVKRGRGRRKEYCGAACRSKAWQERHPRVRGEEFEARVKEEVRQKEVLEELEERRAQWNNFEKQER